MKGAGAVIGWLGLVGLLLAVATRVASGSAQPRPSVIRITAEEVRSRRVEYGPRGAGHVEVIWQALFNRRLTERAIGHAQSLCTTLARGTRNCTATYLLPRGKLVVAGDAGAGRAYELPVIGGTSLYDGARGILSAQITAARPRAETLTFRLQMQP